VSPFWQLTILWILSVLFTSTLWTIAILDHMNYKHKNEIAKLKRSHVVHSYAIATYFTLMLVFAAVIKLFY
jgi:hypothetical protein